MILLPRISGVLMLGVFSINSYIGLKDSVLSKLQPVHEIANFFIAVADLIAASILMSYGQGRFSLVFLSGFIWPVVFIVSLAADIETRMCLFTNVNCFASVSDAYEYLILGRASQGWKLWVYTFPTAISLLLAIIALTLVYTLGLGKHHPEAASGNVNADVSRSE
ncbi:MAG: hypothetical protein ACRDF4_07695 [Rhabdochlamydiaceae bacterium]